MGDAPELRWRRPPPLAAGGVIGVCAPSGPVNAERLEAGLAWLRAAGFRPRLAPHLYARAAYLAGTDAERAADLRALLADPGVDAVVCARGGYGAMRLLPELDLGVARAAPKPLVGFSDITALHLAWAAAGLVSFHGPVLEDSASPDGAFNRQALVAALEGTAWPGQLPTPPDIPAPCTLHDGVVRGRLVGGNLSLIVALLGTPYALNTRGAVLLLEDVHEPPYRLDRYLTQLWLAGKLQAAAGFVIGELVGCEAEGDGPDALTVLADRLTPLGKPCAAGFCLGHGRYRLTVPLGVAVELDAGRPALTILESGLASPVP